MPARKEQDVRLHRANAGHHAVGSGADLIRRLSSRAAVAEQLPFRTFFVNLLGALALVLAIVPFEEVAVGLCCGGEASQLAGPGCALQRAGENLGECQALQALAESTRVVLSALGQGQIGE